MCYIAFEVRLSEAAVYMLRIRAELLNTSVPELLDGIIAHHLVGVVNLGLGLEEEE